MNDGVGAVIATNQPPLGAATSQKGSEVVCVNQDAAVFCQRDHLICRGGGIELTSELRITLHLIKKVIQGI